MLKRVLEGIILKPKMYLIVNHLKNLHRKRINRLFKISICLMLRMLSLKQLNKF